MLRSLLYRNTKSTGYFPRSEWSMWDSWWGDFRDMFVETSCTDDSPNVQVHVIDGKATIKVELAGYDKENITATVQHRLISISGSRDETNFVKTFRVEESFDMDSVSVSYKNGLLTVTLNKLEKAEPDTTERTVPIQ